MTKTDASSTRPPHILVVDDSEDMRDLLGQLLQKEGYQVSFAEDGQTALTQAKRHQPALILMDLSLPDIDGWEAVGHLRKMPAFRHTPIIAVTAHVAPADQERALAVGCTLHLGKPFATKDVLESIERLLPRRGNGHET
jgi:two-component system, cell cycle response regulator DivK